MTPKLSDFVLIIATFAFELSSSCFFFFFFFKCLVLPFMSLFLYLPDPLHDSSGVGVTKAPFVNFSVSKIFNLAKLCVRLFASHSYLTGGTAAEHDIQKVISVLTVVKNWKNSVTEEIGLVTPTPDLLSVIPGDMNCKLTAMEGLSKSWLTLGIINLNSLAPGRFEGNYRSVIFKLNLRDW